MRRMSRSSSKVSTRGEGGGGGFSYLPKAGEFRWCPLQQLPAAAAITDKGPLAQTALSGAAQENQTGGGGGGGGGAERKKK